MAKQPMSYLNDTQFYQWAAVCAKKHLKSNDLLKSVIIDYTNKNLSDAEFKEYVQKTRSAGVAERILGKPITQDSKTANDEVAAVKIENVNEILAKKTILAVKSNRIINVNEISLGDDITSEKIKAIREMYGGKMEVK